MRIPWPITMPPPLQIENRPSLFNRDVRLRIVRRGSQWIAMHWDKRDDDLMPFADLENSVRLKFRNGPELKDGAGSIPDTNVTLSANQWVKRPPSVRDAYFWWEPAIASGERRAAIAFTAPLVPGGRAFENVWRVRMAAFETDPRDPTRLGQVVTCSM